MPVLTLKSVALLVAASMAVIMAATPALVETVLPTEYRINHMLSWHSEQLKNHSAKPLVWSPALAEYAANQPQLYSDPKTTPSQCGINIIMYTPGVESAPDPIDYYLALDSMIQNEKDYHYAEENPSTSWLALTQVLRKSTEQVGRAVYNCESGQYSRIYIYAYDPPGNIKNEFRANLSPSFVRNTKVMDPTY